MADDHDHDHDHSGEEAVVGHTADGQEVVVYIESDDAHDHSGESTWEATVDLVTDPPHLAAEVTMEVASYVIFGLLLTPVIRWAIRRHDRTHHEEES